MSGQQEHVCVGDSRENWKEMSWLFHSKIKKEIIFCIKKKQFEAELKN